MLYTYKQTPIYIYEIRTSGSKGREIERMLGSPADPSSKKNEMAREEEEERLNQTNLVHIASTLITNPMSCNVCPIESLHKKKNM